jgi:hypothetical protein
MVRMTRYFFDLSDGSQEPDTTGTELAGEAAARREAVRFVGEILKFEPERLGDGPLRVVVRAGDCAVLFAVEVTLLAGG